MSLATQSSDNSSINSRTQGAAGRRQQQQPRRRPGGSRGRRRREHGFALFEGGREGDQDTRASWGVARQAGVSTVRSRRLSARAGRGRGVERVAHEQRACGRAAGGPFFFVALQQPDFFHSFVQGRPPRLLPTLRPASHSWTAAHVSARAPVLSPSSNPDSCPPSATRLNAQRALSLDRAATPPPPSKPCPSPPSSWPPPP